MYSAMENWFLHKRKVDHIQQQQSVQSLKEIVEQRPSNNNVDNEVENRKIDTMIIALLIMK